MAAFIDAAKAKRAFTPEAGDGAKAEATAKNFVAHVDEKQAGQPPKGDDQPEK